MSDTVDSTVAEEPQAELVAQEHASTLFRTDDPVRVLERAAEVADALKGVLAKQGLTQSIQGRDHVKVEGWQTLGAMLGVTAVCEWTRALADEKGWEARVIAQTLDGRTIGAAEAMCSRAEQRWRAADDYAVRSMAQTRATSKALGSVLRFVVTLAGFDGTPAEEMDRGEASLPEWSQPTDDQARKRAWTNLKALAGDDKAEALAGRLVAVTGGKMVNATAVAVANIAAAVKAKGDG